MGVAARGQAPASTGTGTPRAPSILNWLARTITLHFLWSSSIEAMARIQKARPLKRASSWITSWIMWTVSNQGLSVASRHLHARHGLLLRGDLGLSHRPHFRVSDHALEFEEHLPVALDVDARILLHHHDESGRQLLIDVGIDLEQLVVVETPHTLDEHAVLAEGVIGHLVVADDASRGAAAPRVSHATTLRAGDFDPVPCP